MKYYVEYESDYCDDFPETRGNFEVDAADLGEALKKAQGKLPRHCVVIEIVQTN